MMGNSNVQIDINDLLESFAAENANAVKRAVIAEAGVKARDAHIQSMEEALRTLSTDLERLRAEYEPDSQPGLIRPLEDLPAPGGHELVSLETEERWPVKEEPAEPTPIKRPTRKRTAASKDR